MTRSKKGAAACVLAAVVGLLAANPHPACAGVGPADGEPAYVRALAGVVPNAAEPYARLVRTVLYGGTVPSDVKVAMGLKVAERNGSPYVTALLRRAASPGAAPRGRAADLALDYADRLTRDAHGVDDAAFARLRGVYDDAQIVELTMAVCFFNHFTRMANALALTPEGEKGVPPGPQAEEGSTRPAPRARVSLASDAEMAAGGRLLASAQTGQNLVGKTVYNSQRAMVRVPDLMEAWFSYWATVRGYNALTNAEKLQVSFAVSKANGCRYCVLHQVAGLRREGVDIAKLLAMEKGDDALTPRERAAVVFARKLTARPADIARADWAALETALGRQGAMEVLLQACAFNFMNRFTDNLGLASEDEAVHTYEQVYGTGAYGRFPAAPR